MKQISLLVIGAHALIVFWMALWLPVKKKSKQPIEIRTVVYKPPALKEATITSSNAKKPRKKPQPKKIHSPKKQKKAPKMRKASPRKKQPLVSNALLKQLEESMAKLEAKPLLSPMKKIKPLSRLTIDEASSQKADLFTSALIKRLQEDLDLPDLGDVKIELTLKNNGQFAKMQILQSKSNRNCKFLENKLPRLHYPPFNGSLKNKTEHTFVITFCNQ